MYKVTVIGEPSTGKTSILRRLHENIFFEHGVSTIGASHINYNDKSSNVKLSIWDTAGQEQFNSLIPMYVRNSHAIIFIYDINDDSTYKRIIEFWFPQVVQSMKECGKCLYYLVANKIDLVTNKQIPEDSLWNSFKFRKCYTSAKNGSGVFELFDVICNDLKDNLEINNDINEFKKRNLMLNTIDNNSGSCCS